MADIEIPYCELGTQNFLITETSKISNFFFSRMTIMSSRRFYVGNLSTEIKDSDITKLFGKFGTVDKIEIKNKSDLDGKVLTTFAFVSFNEISEDNVAKCIQRLNNSLWKKQTIKVQQAQESFLCRLQKEREEAAKPKKIEQTFEPKNTIQHSSAL